MGKKEVRIRLNRLEKELVVAAKSNLLATLKNHSVPVGNACGGQGICASCKVTVLAGAQNLSKPNDKEIELRERNGLARDERVSCQCLVTGDIEITTSYW